METVQDFWQSYKHNVVPVTAGNTQIEETQKAFYAGCFAYMALIKANPAVETFNAIEAELELFLASVGAEHATTN